MELLFTVEQTFWLDGVGLILAPGLERQLEPGTPLFLVTPRGTHVTATVKPLPTRGLKGPIAVDLAREEVGVGTRVFAKVRP